MSGYDTLTYWEERYQKDGVLAPVSKNVHSSSKYESRILDDCRFIETELSKLALKKIKLAVDCGCGCGRITHVLQKFAKQVKAYDISESAIALAKQKNLIEMIEYNCASTTAIPLKDSSVGLVLCWTVLQHLSDVNEWTKAIDEIQRILKPNGIVLSYDNVEWYMKQLKNSNVVVPPHMSTKSPQEYINAFGQCDCIRQKQYGVHSLSIFKKK